MVVVLGSTGWGGEVVAGTAGEDVADDGTLDGTLSSSAAADGEAPRDEANTAESSAVSVGDVGEPPAAGEPCDGTVALGVGVEDHRPSPCGSPAPNGTAAEGPGSTAVLPWISTVAASGR
jgi:hypothetical protein